MNRFSYTGAKIALISCGQLITYQRDHKPEIPFAGMWDLLGGGRESGESSVDCVIRETFEEFGIALDPSSIVWERYYPAKIPTAPGSYFYVAKLKRRFWRDRFW